MKAAPAVTVAASRDGTPHANCVVGASAVLLNSAGRDALGVAIVPLHLVAIKAALAVTGGGGIEARWAVGAVGELPLVTAVAVAGLGGYAPHVPSVVGAVVAYRAHQLAVRVSTVVLCAGAAEGPRGLIVVRWAVVARGPTVLIEAVALAASGPDTIPRLCIIVAIAAGALVQIAVGVRATVAV